MGPIVGIIAQIAFRIVAVPGSAVAVSIAHRPTAPVVAVAQSRTGCDPVGFRPAPLMGGVPDVAVIADALAAETMSPFVVVAVSRGRARPGSVVVDSAAGAARHPGAMGADTGPAYAASIIVVHADGAVQYTARTVVWGLAVVGIIGPHVRSIADAKASGACASGRV